MIYLIVLLSLLSLSQAANLVRLAQAPADVIGFYRLMAACILILPYMFKNQAFQEIKKIKKPTLFLVIFTGFVFYIHLYTFFLAAQNTKIANCMIIFATNPLFTAVGAYFFLNERLTFNLAIAYLLAFIGLYQLFSQSLDFSPEHLFGDGIALVAAILFSAYIILGRIIRKSVTNLSYIFIIFLIAGMFFGLSTIYHNVSLVNYPPITWIAILGLAIIPTLMGHALYNYSLKFLDINFLSCGKLLEPPFSAFVAFLLFNETLNNSTMISFSFTGVAILVLFGPELWKNRKKLFINPR